MFKKIKNIVLKTDSFLYKKFGSYKSTKVLENIKEAHIIFSYLNDAEEKNNKVRFVGGCVRKAIDGENIDDIDLATSLTPDIVKKKLGQKNIKVVDTGISHGTVTAIFNNKKFEITTLRKDVSTDGRHANVVFTSNWELDAFRRDFTFNAIYADMLGRIYDPVNGVEDLKNGKVKFIGIPEERIQEDYLRILRYFRFFAQYSKKEHDQNTISCIKKYINGLNKVSKERIFYELKKILKLTNIYNLFSQDDSRDIVLNIFPQFKYYKRLKIIGSLRQELRDMYDVDLIIGLLLVDGSNEHEYFSHKYKVSNITKNRLANISKNFESLKNRKFYSKENIMRLIYFSNKNYVKDLLLFSLATNVRIKNLDIENLINFVNVCKIPKFPITGDFLKEHGYETGRLLGQKLESLEKKWIDNNFILENKVVRKFLEKSDKN
tara:strand:- start:304 stop:1605 length:1302 start_codon:yes stop_codon:yes gene_type:complete